MNKKIVFLSMIVYFISFTIQYESPSFNQTDSLWNSATTIEIIERQTFSLNQYQDLFPSVFYTNLHEVNGTYYNRFPFGISLISIPPLYFLKFYYKYMNGIDLEQKFRKSSIRLDKNLASFYSALSAVLIFLLSYNILRSYKDSLFMAFIFAFGTLMFSCVSRGLWQHNATILLYSIVIIALRKDNNKWTVYAISPLVFSYLVRPTSLLPILVLLPILIYSNRSRWLIIIAQLILIASMFLCINYSLFNTWNHPYYDFTKISHMKHFWEASIGNLLSPSRGLFIYSPIFLFSFLGIYFKYKVEKLRAFELGMIFIIFIHWISISKNENWWGGHSYGYRLFSDMIPFLSYFYIFFWKYNSIKLFKYIFYISIFISIAINSIGAIRIESYLWNVTPNNIDTNPSRNWDWKDPPFLR